MRKYFDVVFLTTSIPAVGAKVFVTNSQGNLATLYSDNGVTQTSNPLTTDVAGMYAFYVSDGNYTLTYQINGYTLRTLTDVQIYDESQFASGGPNFGLAMTSWFQALPTTLPATSGVLWNNGGTLALS